MCGIAGIFRFDGQGADPAALRRMADTMIHRGPDGEGFSLRGPFGLAHRRLAIIDLEGGRQPMSNEDGEVEVTFNGEIYNFDVLRTRLQSKGHVFRTRSDTEVLVHLYEEEGDRMAESLRGEFAFAIADHRRRRMLLARDRMGVKPLYWAIDGNRLIFGSEAKAVLAEGSTPRALDPAAVMDYAALRYVPSPRTIFAAMRKLPPAHVLLVEADGRHEVRRYWELRVAPDERPTAAEWAERIREKMDEAVRIEMVADVPVGAFLSGGVDSSAVVTSMAAISPRPVVACTIGFGESAYDERDAAREVAKLARADHREMVVTPKAAEVVETLAWHYDEPFGDSSAVPTYYVSRMARQHVTVALSGDGGDENFAGYRRYRFERAEDRLRRMLPAALRNPLFRGLAAAWPKGDALPRFLRAKSTFASLAEADPAAAYFRGVASLAGFHGEQVVRRDVVEAAGGHDPARLIADAFRRSGTGDPVARAAFADFSSWLPEDILVKTDRAAMANSLEVRVPLLDHEFVELAATVPPSLKLRGGEGKWIFKEALAPRVPRAMLDRPKQGFAVPVREWLRGDLHDYAADLLLAPGARSAEWFDAAAVRRLWDAHQSGARDASDALWRILMFEGFARKHLAPSSAPDRAAAGATA
ncbi:MAG: Asparagine synthetase [glutamine-hydrolyzing] 1 [Planctomycetes bacterium]|nr:Asparagine synthetase [glutamine-hydrolyzing] 1 [Planctomycetota bacterium]